VGVELGPLRDTQLALLGAFDLTVDGERVVLPMNGQRLIAFLALRGGPLQRSYVAGSLWLDSTDDRAAGNLRSTLWRVNRQCRLVEGSAETLQLAEDVLVDHRVAVVQAQALLDPSSTDCPSPREVRLFADLLPDWYDEWITIERERFRQLRAHALERLAERLAEVERFGEAVEAALAAVAVEPLRESAHRVLVRVHLAEGNRGEALACYLAFRELLERELGLAPSEQLDSLVAAIKSR
jgi:DNA-binding SARP family transcriptional activator